MLTGTMEPFLICSLICLPGGESGLAASSRPWKGFVEKKDQSVLNKEKEREDRIGETRAKKQYSSLRILGISIELSPEMVAEQWKTSTKNTPASNALYSACH